MVIDITRNFENLIYENKQNRLLLLKKMTMKRMLLVFFASIVISANVNAQWSSNPLVNTQITSLVAEQELPKIALCPNGDYYIGYFSNENGNYNIRLQRIDNNGIILWQPNGILVSSHPSMSWITDWDMVADHDNHAILAWQDIRSGGDNNVYAYRISSNGEFVWGPNGIPLSNSSDFDATPTLTVTSANNTIVAWQSNLNVIITQKLNANGEKLWGEWGITHSCPNRYTWP